MRSLVGSEALFAHQLVDDVLGDVVLPVAARVPAPRADRIALLDQRLDLGLDSGAVSIAIGLLEVELVKPVPNLGQPSAFLGSERWDRGGHDPLSCTFSDYGIVTQ